MNQNMQGLPPGDPKLIEDVVNRLKSQGIFDQFRKECLADVDTKVNIKLWLSISMFTASVHSSVF